MKIIPAIDLINKKAVRLEKGDYSKQTDYSTDPVSVAVAFAEAGATELHVVDLDGARTGSPENISVIREIIAASGMNVEVGGGIRDEARLNAYLEAGAARVIIGTAAIENPEFTREAAARHGERLAVGVDVRDGRVATRGWLGETDTDGESFCKALAASGVKHIIYTDISKDGMLGGTNLEAYRTLSKIEGIKLTASGGVSDLNELYELKKSGVWGVIIGKALYAGKINLKEALRAEHDN